MWFHVTTAVTEVSNRFPDFWGPNGIVCRECASALDLTSKENRPIIRELVKLCKNVDSIIGKKLDAN